jgi:hypothetical protein
MRFIVALTLLLTATAAAAAQSHAQLQARLDVYRAELMALRRGRPQRELPDVRFFLFGMGARDKFIYQDGVLRALPSGRVLHQWNVISSLIVPPLYTVWLLTSDNHRVVIREDEKGLWLEEDDRKKALTEAPLHLPEFSGHPYANVLKVLHHEILVNIADGKPLPNMLAYSNPWYRDGAMMSMVLARTGNLDLVKPWIVALREPYDGNNQSHGVPETEADNLGQALYLISLAGDRMHPLLPALLRQVERFRQEDSGKVFIQGRSDFGLHPAYQTKWLKFGLRSLTLPDVYSVPLIVDSYSALFWWDYKQEHVEGARFSAALGRDYPYLAWAEDHFYGETRGPMSNRDYPLSWEANASQADYERLRIVSPSYVRQRLCAPHTWHAAEMFLYLVDAQR